MYKWEEARTKFSQQVSSPVKFIASSLGYILHMYILHLHSISR